MTAPEFDPTSFVAMAFKTKDGFGKTIEFIRADLHDATKEQMDKAWETCFAATNRGMIAERKLAKAVEALRNMVVIAEADKWDKALTGREMVLRDARAVLAEIEKGEPKC